MAHDLFARVEDAMCVLDGLLEGDCSVLFKQVFGSHAADPRSEICNSAFRSHILVVDDDSVVVDDRNSET